MNNNQPVSFALSDGLFDFTPEIFENGVMLSNMFCDFLYLERQEFDEVISGDFFNNQSLKNKLIKNRFFYESREDFINTSSLLYRKLKGFHFSGTVLHIFVLTLNCNLKCLYCQATAGHANSSKSMTVETADVCLNRAFETLSNNIDIEFQGGEPLLNFPVLQHIVLRASKLAKQKNKKVTFSVVTNLSALTEDMAEFLASHDVNIAVSLDGSKEIHDFNRAHSNPDLSNFDDVVKGLDLLRRFYKGPSNRINALLTITNKSFGHIDEIIDAYALLGFQSIGVRPLSQLGVAKENWVEIGYSPEDFGQYYYSFLVNLLNRSLRGGFNIVEFHARMFLQKIFNKAPINHMEFRSPCGAAIGQITYNWDGNAFTCDEGRMLASMGDNTFQLGNVFNNSYQSMLDSTKVKAIVNSSCMESLPDCSYCVFQPLCGVCPIYNYSKYGDLYRSSCNDYLCQTRKEIFKAFFKILFEGPEELKGQLVKWGQADE